MMGQGQTAGCAAGRQSSPRRAALALVVLVAAALMVLTATAGPAAADDPPAPPPSAPSAIIIDRITGRVLYGHGIHTRRPMASTTKIMTALIVVQRAPYLSRKITAPPAVAFSSGIGLRPGERISIKNALLGLMVRSAQDCGVTLATAIAGSEAAFVRLMNAKAHKLGLRDTTYRNANGSYSDSRHRSSAYDLSRLARYAMKNGRFRDLARRQRAVVYWGRGRKLAVRSNNLLLHFDWVDGVKCGFTKAAGICLVGSGKPGLRPFITATLGSRNRAEDARDHVALYEWASGLYEEKTVITAGDVFAAVRLDGGGEVQVAAKTTLTAVVRSAAPVRLTVALPGSLPSRPPDGRVVGSVVYRADGVQLGTVKLVVAPEPPAQTPAPETPAPTATPVSASGLQSPTP